MLTLETQQAKLDSLLSTSPSIPGLDLNTIAPNFVESKFSKDLNKTKTPEEREKLKSTLVNHYKTEGKSFIEDNIASIKSSAEQLAKGVTSIPITITGITATLAVPTSAAAAVPMISSLTSFLDSLKAHSTTLLKSATAIGFILPEPIFALITTVEGLYNLIPKIPS
jgi:hypothetical protein